MKSSAGLFLTVLLSMAGSDVMADRHPLVLLSDFGTTERFVASMKGVAMTVDDRLQVHDLTHHIEPFDIWQASWVLAGTIEYWPKGTVFVSVVDPGVGTSRKSVVARTGNGYYIVTPDNGTLTLVADAFEIVARREIDETVNRRPGSEASHTFHGRDVYAFTGARLAAGVIDFEGVGPLLDGDIVRLAYQRAEKSGNGVLGNLVHVEIPFGNLVTNIPASLLASQGILPDRTSQVQVRVRHGDELVFDAVLPFVGSFGFVAEGKPLLYTDSLQMAGLAINSRSFADAFQISAGPDWTVTISPLSP